MRTEDLIKVLEQVRGQQIKRLSIDGDKIDIEFQEEEKISITPYPCPYPVYPQPYYPQPYIWWGTDGNGWPGSDITVQSHQTHQVVDGEFSPVLPGIPPNYE